MEFKFPDLGEGIAEGELVKWLVKPGDTVKEDQEVAEVETDKALVSIPSPTAGVVETLHYKEGDTVKVGSVLITFSEGGKKSEAKEEKPEPKKEATEKAEAKPEPKEAKEPVEAEKPAAKKAEPEPAPIKSEKADKPPAPQAPAPSGPPLAAPHTRKLARELGVDLTQVKGSGPQGRIIEDDVRNFTSKKAPEAEPYAAPAAASADELSKYGRIERISMKGVRRKISEHMMLAARETVMVTHIDEAEVGKLLKIRKDKMEYAEKRGIKLTLLPFLMKACVIALRNYPYLNASLVDDEIILKKYYNFGFAVDTDAGLMVPVIKEVDQKSIMRIALELKELSEKARDRSISLDDFRGHTFSITNIGSIGGKAFTPIIHYPDAAILGLGRTYEKPVAHDGKVEAAWVLPLCLTFDHRVTDGATAARFVNEVIKYLQDPDLLLLDDGES